MFNGRKNLFVILLAGALVVGLSSSALAQNTASGTIITNTATLDYSVNTVPQAQVSSLPVSFVVDNKVDLTVTTIDGAIVSVIPGLINQVLTYSVTNNGNTVQDYSLQALDSAIGAFGEAESFDAANVRVFVDNGDNTYTAADTDTYIDELGIGATITVFVVSDIPLAQINGDVASYDLVAQTAVGGVSGTQGADIVNDDRLNADDPTLVQIVFADGDAPGLAEGPRDGRHASLDGYMVVTADLEAVKTFNVISDPFNLAVNPKAIPGATVGYQVLVNNSGTVTADNVEVIDSIPANNSFLLGTVTTIPAVPATAITYSNDNGANWTYVPVDSGNGTDPAVTDVRVIFATVAGGGTAQENFSVLID